MRHQGAELGGAGECQAGQVAKEQKKERLIREGGCSDGRRRGSIGRRRLPRQDTIGQTTDSTEGPR